MVSLKKMLSVMGLSLVSFASIAGGHSVPVVPFITVTQEMIDQMNISSYAGFPEELNSDGLPVELNNSYCLVPGNYQLNQVWAAGGQIAFSVGYDYRMEDAECTYVSDDGEIEYTYQGTAYLSVIKPFWNLPFYVKLPQDFSMTAQFDSKEPGLFECTPYRTEDKTPETFDANRCAINWRSPD